MTLLNLTVNARDAMPDGGQIVIATQEEVLRAGDGSRLKPGAYICLTVRDTGDGMDEETLRRAMEPFFTTKGPGKGTGPWPVHGARCRRTIRRMVYAAKPEGRRHDRRALAAGRGRQAPAIGSKRRGRPSDAVDQAALVVLAVDDDGSC